MRWAIVVITCAGCYSPSYRDCEVSCASGAGCPSGLSCDESQHLCRLPGMTDSCGGGSADAGIDVNTTCWNGVTPTNFAPCDPGFPMPLSNVTFINGEAIDTGQGTLVSTGTAAPGQSYTLTGDVWLIHVTSWTIPAGNTFNIIGGKPLLVVSDGDVVIDGTISVLPSGFGTGMTCGLVDGGTSAFSGAGGAGGGFGDRGGDGGTNGDADTPGPPGGAMQGTPTLDPLGLGCPGGRGGEGGDPPHAGTGGLGGGAVEIASATKIMISGGIVAGGAGGGAGGASIAGANGCTGTVACAGGGGGGGAGGAILVEAPTIDEVATGKLCAAGGGGGEGGDSSMAVNAAAGSPGGCTAGAAGTGPGMGGDGGNGSIAVAAAAGSQGLEVGSPSGGGGGGGGPGRIRVHATTKTLAGTTAPAAAP